MTKNKLKYMGLKASEYGKQIIKTKREELGWTYNNSRWLKAAGQLLDPNWPDELFFEAKYPPGISEGTLKRFQGGKKPIDIKIFKVYCQVLELPWRDIAESCFVGRNQIVTNLINMLQESHRLILLTGITGTGKTALAEKIISELPDSYTEKLKFSFEDSEQEPLFASVATQIISQLQKLILPSEINQPENIMLCLVDYICNHQCVLLIDSLELALQGDQNTGWSNFKDSWWEKFFRALIASPRCQGKIIITSQEMPIQLEEILINSHYLCCHELVRGFTDIEIREFFQSEGIEFAENTEIANYLHRIGTAYEGHPLALKTITGEILNFPFNGDVNRYWCEYRSEIEAIEQAYKDLDLESLNDKFQLDSYSKKLNLAYCYVRIKNAEALVYIDKALNIAKHLKSSELLGMGLARLAYYYWQQGNYIYALMFILKSFWVCPPWKNMNSMRTFQIAIQVIRNSVKQAIKKYIIYFKNNCK
ncbi:NACHT domain-containing protein [Sphaerospermopsis aphanizomenoides BCCUSP55]|uniref:NACHT domain-containing protein n=1 Tax=Sphaerospermopsis aphanizomenoides TaxID=459663 RepID=UPI001907AACF|nr:NACHT domain-containing protein [Sphaerospermopsis aphanizomenoides]MBK1988304.1 NACHT domain-containing protein [Sphaerospermopsis aphanizomenoides BCCUSP55]